MRTAVWQWMVVASLGLLGILLPVGVPPLPEDPALLRMAPADTVAYVSWFGRVEAGQPGNRTEALLAEPDVQRFGERLWSAVQHAVTASAGPEDGGAFARELLGLCSGALERPGCAFLALPEGGELPRVGLVLSVGEDAPAWERRMRVLESRIAEALQRMEGEEPAADPDPVDDVRFRALPLPAGGPTVAWAVAEGYLMVSLGAEAAQAMVAGLRGDAGLSGTPLMRKLREKAKVERPMLRTFLNAAPLLELAAETGGKHVAGALAVLGLDQVEGLLSESGLQGDGYATCARLELKARKGMFDLFGAQPLGVDDLALVPKDATYAVGLSLDAEKTLDWILRIAELDYEGAARELEDEIAAPMQQMLGVDLRKDLLAHLDDRLVAWNSPAQGGLLFTGFCAAVPLADGEAFGRSFATLMERMEKMAPHRQRDDRGRVRRDYYLEKGEHAGRAFWWLNPVGDDVPFAITWTATDTHLLFSLYPQMMRDVLERGADPDSSLARNPAVAGHAGAVALQYLDARDLAERLYPLLPMLMTLGASEWQRAGFDLNAADLPRLSSLLPHLGAEVSVLQADDTGLQLTHHGTLPGIVDPVLSTVLQMAALPWVLLRAEAVQAGEVRRVPEEAGRGHK